MSETPHLLYTSRREWALLGCDLICFKSILDEKMNYALLFMECIDHFYKDDKKSVGD